MNTLRNGFVAVVVLALFAFGMANAASNSNVVCPKVTVYVGHSTTCGGLTVTLTGLGPTMATNGTKIKSAALITISFKGIESSGAVPPGQTAGIFGEGYSAGVYVQSTHLAQHPWEEWARIQISVNS